MLYRALSLLFSGLGGLLAGVVFRRVWKLAGRQDDVPDADDADRTWREVLIVAALQGAIFGLVQAATQRAGAEAVRRTTGSWPGDD